MVAKLQPVELNPALLKMDGISQRQIEEHYNILYKGYVNKTNEIWEKLQTVDRSTANQSYSDLRALKTDESFTVDGVKLHEAYFANLGGKGGRPTGRTLELIVRDFGSYEAWETDFKAAGIAARGWVVLACDEDFGATLHNYSQDAHNQGAIWNAIPLLVLDTYEHAYFIDYGAKRAPYIDAFMRNINWEFVAEKVKKLGC
jgi:superoxide dismutase, Fe-Mn family